MNGSNASNMQSIPSSGIWTLLKLFRLAQVYSLWRWLIYWPSIGHTLKRILALKLWNSNLLENWTLKAIGIASMRCFVHLALKYLLYECSELRIALYDWPPKSSESVTRGHKEILAGWRLGDCWEASRRGGIGVKKMVHQIDIKRCTKTMHIIEPGRQFASRTPVFTSPIHSMIAWQ